MTRRSYLDLARAERSDLLEVLRDLSPEEWAKPSLCARWSTGDVVTHLLSYEGVGVGALAVAAVKRFLPGRRGAASGGPAGPFGPADALKNVDVASWPRVDPAGLLATLEAHLTPDGLTAKFGGRIALTDGMIHQQDIRRPLGRLRPIPEERLVTALAFAMFAPPVGAFRRVRGLRLEATDVGWAHGRGPLVTGPGEALLLAAAGRPVVLPELSGDGVAVLAARMPADAVRDLT